MYFSNRFISEKISVYIFFFFEVSRAALLKREYNGIFYAFLPNRSKYPYVLFRKYINTFLVIHSLKYTGGVMRRYVYLFFSFLLFRFMLIQAEVIIPDKSDVSGLWTAAQSPYIIEGEATVPVDSTLRIEAGVEVRFQTGMEPDYLNTNFDLGFLRVEGKLTAEGTADRPVIFTRNGDSGNWGILYFHTTADSSSIMKYCRVEFASQVLHINDWREHPGAVSLNETFLTLKNCRIINNANDGFFADNASSVLQNCLIAENDNGLLATNYCDLQITNCTITNNAAIGYNAGYNATADVVNSIFWANQKSIESNLTSAVNLSYSLLAENDLPEGLSNGPGNLLGINPYFNDAEAGDYALRSHSFCINTGADDTSGLHLQPTDLTGQERILNGRIDMGAYEFVGSYLRLTVPNGLESWKIGTTQTIRWQSNVSTVDLQYSADNGQIWQTISTSESGSGSYDWLIPDEMSEQCLVRVNDASDPLLSDQSDTTFIISDKTIIVDGKYVSGSWTKEYSPYVVRGEAILPQDSQLVIEPGVEIRFATGDNHDYSLPDFNLGMLRVNGRLIAEGTEEDSIRFTRDGDNGNWGILFFNENQTDSSLLGYVIVEHASYIDSLPDSLTLSGAVSLYGAGIQLERSRLSNNRRNAIHIAGKSSPQIRYCRIASNDENGILLSDNQGKNNPLLYGNDISDNGADGVSIQTTVNCHIEYNGIENNGRYGIYNYSGYAQTKVVNNRIHANNVGIYCNGLIEITDNLIASNNQGIFLEHLDPQIMNNTIVNNREEGIYCIEASPFVTNCVFSGNSNDFDFESGDASNPYVIYSLFRKSYIHPKATDGGGNRVGYNPAFVNEGQHPFALMSNSPAVDAGTTDNVLVTLPETDLAGKPRIYDGNNDGNSIVDMGAYEFSALTADFSADVTVGEKPLNVQFTNQSVGEIDSLIWHFGDGDSSFAENPAHVYSDNGKYTVHLRIYGKLGSSERIRQEYIIVEQAPQVINPAADTSFIEDSGEHFILYFPDVFSDPDSADTLLFTAQSNETQTILRIQGDSLFINFKENYYGKFEVIITATDPYDLSAADTFLVTVNPVNDPPIFLDDFPDTLRFRADSSVTLETWRYVSDAETPSKALLYMYGVSNDSIIITVLDSSFSVVISAKSEFRGQGWLYIGVQDDSLEVASDSLLVVVESPLALDEEQNRKPLVFDLAPNYPNPFNPQTTIRYSVGWQQNASVRIELNIYNILGEKVAVLFSGRKQPGVYKAVWNASGYPSGVYIVRFSTANGYYKARKIILLK